ncbi:MAG: hypothetical protein QXJ93_02435 [Candidatus Rehaiarchaeum fermentans]|nr:hypothetical protein [Candidatus Rehaiarchaeum fermentans]
MIINLIAFLIYLALAFIGFFSVLLSSRIVVNMSKNSAIIKSAFFLNRDSVLQKLKLIYIVGIFLFITALFTFLQKIFAYVFTIQLFNYLFYFLAYIFGIISAVLFFFVLYTWNKMIKKYVSKSP